ncbi:hypothetical protein F506_10030 [Herbaspirillum hiltneri N3]|uniref:Uncharacterized protein n=1 Tax=Herbaspirillum hiltneri N3 TaxID=1262470 RepID=A0ABN4HVW7_9BURK|nr:hypothetical protein [Herbaspirillum hiltneri]AKZ62960.1 hypothetical protein F506_10030 [Herbaspirillum hiltneri N3]
MQFIVDTVPNDIALMFVTYLGFCMLLMFLFIRADCEWNKREMKLSRERLRVLSADRENSDRLRELTACSVHHDVNCACFLHSNDADATGKNAA